VACAGFDAQFSFSERKFPMSFFRRPDYVSDTTQFIEQLKREHPQLEAEQRQGRALLWDKSISRDDQKAFKDARVAQKPYVYQTLA
jgi:hypothetical protein